MNLDDVPNNVSRKKINQVADNSDVFKIGYIMEQIKPITWTIK